jgi:alpha-1,2-mannosyltransferase
VRLVRGGGPGIASASCVLAAVALWTEPVTTTIWYGQINLLLLALVLWDFNLPADSRRRGIGVGLAAGLKVTPAIVIAALSLGCVTTNSGA